jgi:AcrR family transcriptional regulator
MSTMATTGRKATRGEQTKSAIVDAALGLFEEVGYESTTMRAIAERAGVSVGNAYYYFDSKEQLVQGFYDRAAEQHLTASAERLIGVRGLAERIHGHLSVWFELMGVYHQFAGQFFRTAADPAGPMSPFSDASSPARDKAIERWRTVIEESDATIADDVGAELPELMWLFHMGLILFWVHDRSPDQIATRLAAGRLVPVVVKAIDLVEVPELRSLVEELLGLLHDVRQIRSPGDSDASAGH